jgi:hypothetical protein
MNQSAYAYDVIAYAAGAGLAPCGALTRRVLFLASVCVLGWHGQSWARIRVARGGGKNFRAPVTRRPSGHDPGLVEYPVIKAV